MGIGTNFSLKQKLNESLFDEKIGGSIHIALGAGYKECGGDPSPDIHWDIVCDMRRKGTIVELGKRKIMQNGKLLLKGVK